MKSIIYIFIFLIFLDINANDANDQLNVEMEGLVVVVLDFEEGDKIKLFEVETGDHILSKTHGEVDLSQLPVGSYLLENSQGQSIIIDRLEEEINIEGISEELVNNEFIVQHDSKRVYLNNEIDVNQEFASYYQNSETNLLQIERNGNIVTVSNFEEGDKIKLFEIKNTVHILSKTSNYVDLSQLPIGVYVLENNKGESVVIEKFADDNDLIADM
ncbi:hypothetical protein [Aquimarina algicola]|uniref:Uncharacterized protein n=1 Tax=Aquimarina algicola TaxID=2589995 RepID=A0A504JDQ0_9FLAO|nr:hypothetical protein [Aquimarina algicola]TPN84700.1 hypothetical protein FHK87_17385 [Aquimarina algicola]